MRKIGLLFLSIVFTSCGILLSDKINLELGGNDYQNLSKSQLSLIRDYNDVDSVPMDTNRYLFETNAHDILKEAKQQKWLWVHFWKPWCPNDLCQDLSFFEFQRNKHKQDSLHFILLSATYNLQSIDTICRRSGYSAPVYVVENSKYGPKAIDGYHQMQGEMGVHLIFKDKIADDILFHQGKLVYAGHIFHGAQLDSLLHLNTNP